MLDTMTRYLAGLKETAWRRALRFILEPVVDRYSSQPLNSAGLVISSAGATTAKIGANDFYASVVGDLVKIAAGTVMPALTGINIAAANFNVVCFFVNAAGTVTAVAGTQGASLAASNWPQFPENQALIGFLIITYASAFTGGTTPLDTATTVYVSPLGAFDPTVLI
jgi:hypothetical protein